MAHVDRLVQMWGAGDSTALLVTCRLAEQLHCAVVQVICSLLCCWQPLLRP
jgi:hypothetical protein